MVAVIVCNLCTVVILAGLMIGIVAGFVQARVAIGTALAFDPFADVTLAARPRWTPA